MEVTLVKVLPECYLYKCVWTEQVVCCVLTGWRDENGVCLHTLTLCPTHYKACCDDFVESFRKTLTQYFLLGFIILSLCVSLYHTETITINHLYVKAVCL